MGEKVQGKFHGKDYQASSRAATAPSHARSETRRAKVLGKTEIEFHWQGYQNMGQGTHLEKRLKCGDPGINWLDSHARNVKDKWKADDKMIRAINALPRKKTWTEATIKRIMQAKRKLKL